MRHGVNYMRTILIALLITIATQVGAFTQFDSNDSYDFSGMKGISEPPEEPVIGLLAASCQIKKANAIIIIYMKNDGMHFVVSEEGQRFFKRMKNLTEIEPYNFLFEDSKKRTTIYLKRVEEGSWKLVKNQMGDFSSFDCDDHSSTLKLFLSSIDLPTIELLQKLN